MGTRNEILDELVAIAGRIRPLPLRIDPEAHLVEDLGFDSIELLTLAVEVEDHFRVRLDDLDTGAITTVDELVATIELRRR